LIEVRVPLTVKSPPTITLPVVCNVVNLPVLGVTSPIGVPLILDKVTPLAPDPLRVAPPRSIVDPFK